ncbi:uncharacterized protein C8Q71DRAFT_741159 [Rhodofomes roseus]|uniref:F-box domain-containing protein n=1 Tax=Rhodofomes roseus TaxID=34475 RepID=A0ABQ8KRN0_9APHY|nr:uncharacterized protein C8Q71DRAFT_741159 [Rhodofomes roseus]KAH9840775.1 hypothetical protein C8Q71DRAFT_741159 [Rhodofomes roseus]
MDGPKAQANKAPCGPAVVSLPDDSDVELNLVLDGLFEHLDQVATLLTNVIAASPMRMGKLKQRRETLHERFLKLDKAISMLKTLRNHFVPASALPSEIWRRIFRLAVVSLDDDALMSDSDPPESVTLPLCIHESSRTVITTVCHFWRDICMTIPSLWSHISGLPTKLQHVVLERYPTTPLRIYLWHMLSENLRLLQCAQSLRPRYTDLWWYNCDYSVISTHEQLNLPARDVNVLTLASYSRIPIHPNSGCTLFGNDTPHLQSVSLFGLDWVPLNRFVTITQLLIRNCSWSNPFSTILGVLSGTPQLVDLVISEMTDGQPGEAAAESEAAGKIVLKGLRRLALRDIGAQDVAQLLSRLELGPQTVIVMNESDVLVSGHIGVLPEGLSHFPLMMPTQMQLTLCHGGHCMGSQELSFVAVNQNAGVILRERRVVPVDKGYDFLTRIFQLSCLRDLWYLETCYHLPGNTPWPSRAWSSILPELIAVENLWIFDSSLPHIRHSLDDIDWRAEATPICPQLARITILLSWRSAPVDEVMAHLIAIQKRLGFRYLTVGYLPQYAEATRCRSDGDPHFDSVEYVHFDTMPPIVPPWPDLSLLPDLPRACWPSIQDETSQIPPFVRLY